MQRTSGNLETRYRLQVGETQDNYGNYGKCTCVCVYLMVEIVERHDSEDRLRQAEIGQICPILAREIDAGLRHWVTTLGYDTFLGERQLQVGSYATMCGCCSFFIMRINRRSKCQFCECKPVGRTTSEVKWHLCYRHLRAAGGNGFLPVLYGTKSKIMPGRAVRMTVEE